MLTLQVGVTLVLTVTQVYVFINLRRETSLAATLRWHGRHSAEVNENINLGYSQDQGYS